MTPTELWYAEQIHALHAEIRKLTYERDRLERRLWVVEDEKHNAIGRLNAITNKGVKNA